MSFPRYALPLAAAALSLVLGLFGCNSGTSALLIVSPPDRSTPAGEDYSYVVVLINSAGAPTFALQGPTGMSISSTGVITWSPALGDLGFHDVTVTVTENGDSDVQEWTLHVHQDIDLGVTFSPAGHENSTSSSDQVAHYTNTAHGRLLAFHMNWRDTIASAGTAPRTARNAMSAADTYGFTPVIGFGWTDRDGEPDLTSDNSFENSWLNNETRLEFIAMVTSFAANFQPPYLFLGYETNTYYLTHTQAEWDAWIEVFEACYDAIKAASPDTVVYTTFQLERMKGLGQNIGWTDAAHFDLLDDHDPEKIDAIGFTSFPHFEYDAPGSIRASHWTEIGVHWAGSVIISETAWPADDVGSYPGSAEQQEQYVSSLFSGTETLDLTAVVYLYLHDIDSQDSTPELTAVGLRNNDASSIRLADAAWQAAVVLRQR